NTSDTWHSSLILHSKQEKRRDIFIHTNCGIIDVRTTNPNLHANISTTEQQIDGYYWPQSPFTCR
ncbi:hypothetical protein Prudu_017219, partial [Prunus dulcis]